MSVSVILNSFILSLTGWNLSTALSITKLQSVGNTAGAVGDLAFSTDGTKAYVLSYSSDTIYQFTLSTPWDISTSLYANKSMSVAAQETTPQGIAFSSDGTKAYVVGPINDTVYQYTLSTPWDISTGTYANKFMSVLGQTSTSKALAFSTDGTKAYVSGDDENTIYQYTLSTPWDISTGSYASKSMSVAAEDSGPYGVTFSSDGTKVYVAGGSTDTVYQYTLTTAWDISTGSYASKSMSVASQDGQPEGIAISSDGTKVYVIGGNTSTIYQYTLSTPDDISTGTYVIGYFSVVSQETNAAGLEISADGSKMYVVGHQNDTIYQYTLSTPYDASTGVYASKLKSVGAEGSSPRGLAISSDGSKMYMIDLTNNTVFQYTLSTPYDISTATYSTKFKNVSAQETGADSVTFKPDGTKMYVVGIVNDTVYQYTLSTPWDVSTASYDSISKSVGAQDGEPRGLRFKTDGTRMFITGGAGENKIFQYNLSSAWDITTATHVTTLNVDGVISTIGDIVFNPIGTKLYVTSAGTDKIFQYTLS